MDVFNSSVFVEIVEHGGDFKDKLKLLCSHYSLIFREEL